MQAVAIVGAVIMPHNIFLHSALVSARKFDRTNKDIVRQANKYFSNETAVSLFISFLINLAILATFSNQFFKEECAKQHLAYINDKCQEIGLAEAGSALETVLGKSAVTLWAIGLLAAGQASTMTGAFAGQYVMEGFLDLKLVVWKRVLITRSIALVPAVIVAIASDQGQKNGYISDRMDEWLNVLQSIQLPFAILPVLHFTSSYDIMGIFKNTTFMQLINWSLAIIVIIINIILVTDSLFGKDSTVTIELIIFTLFLSILYFTFIIYLISYDIKKFIHWIKLKCNKHSHHILLEQDEELILNEDQ